VIEELGMVTGPDSLDINAVKENPNWMQVLGASIQTDLPYLNSFGARIFQKVI